MGSADDELLSLTDVATGTTWDYADGRAISAKDSAGNILSEYGYDDETKIITVSQTDGSVFKYSYRDSGDPFGTSTLTSARFQRDGEWVTQSYEEGRLSQMCYDSGSCDTYTYDLSNNLVTIRNDAATWVYQMGGDQKLGGGDDFLISMGKQISWDLSNVWGKSARKTQLNGSFDTTPRGKMVFLPMVLRVGDRTRGQYFLQSLGVNLVWAICVLIWGDSTWPRMTSD